MTKSTQLLPWFLHELRPGHYMTCPYLVLDFETTTAGLGNFGSALDPKNDLVLACWKWNSEGEVHAKFGGVFEQQELVSAVTKLIDRQGVLIAHNAKYELQWLCRLGIDVNELLVFDTQIAEYVLLGNLAAGDRKRGLASRSTSLDACCRRRALPGKEPVVDMLIKGGVCPSEIPDSWLLSRCSSDVSSTELLFLDQRAHLQRTGRLPVQYTRCLLTPVLAQVEFNGMHLSAARVEAEHARQAAELCSLEASLDRMTGGINSRSTDQMGAFIYDTLKFAELTNARGKPKRTGSGKRATGRDTISALEAKTEKQRQFKELHLKIGKSRAALSKNLDFFLGVVRERDCVFTAQFNQCTTATHRLSSSGMPIKFDMFDKAKSVQFQNLPREFKRLFCARRHGWKMFEADGAQLEFRVAGHGGHDFQILADILSKHDAHKFTAMILNGLTSVDQVTKEQRQSAKADTFKPLYGGEKGTPEQERYYAAFRERYPGLARMQEGWLAEVMATGRLMTEWGMRYYFPHATVSRSGYCNVKSAIYNYPVQALATAEIIPIAVVYLWHRLRRSVIADKVLLTNTVHDSVVGEVHESAVGELRELCKQAFTNDVYAYLEEVYGMKFTVPLGLGFTVGEFWGEGKEEKFESEAPYDMAA